MQFAIVGYSDDSVDVIINGVFYSYQMNKASVNRITEKYFSAGNIYVRNRLLNEIKKAGDIINP